MEKVLVRHRSLTEASIQREPYFQDQAASELKPRLLRKQRPGLRSVWRCCWGSGAPVHPSLRRLQTGRAARLLVRYTGTGCCPCGGRDARGAARGWGTGLCGEGGTVRPGGRGVLGAVWLFQGWWDGDAGVEAWEKTVKREMGRQPLSRLSGPGWQV